jgi:hypothetical protein
MAPMARIQQILARLNRATRPRVKLSGIGRAIDTLRACGKDITAANTQTGGIWGPARDSEPLPRMSGPVEATGRQHCPHPRLLRSDDLPMGFRTDRRPGGHPLGSARAGSGDLLEERVSPCVDEFQSIQVYLVRELLEC